MSFSIYVTIILTALACLGLHELDVAFIKAANKDAVSNAQAVAQKVCKQNDQLTGEVSHEYENNIAAADAQLNNLERVQYPATVSIAASSPGRNGTANIAGSVGSHAVPINQLYDFAGDYKKERIKLLSCQEWANKVVASQQH